MSARFFTVTLALCAGLTLLAQGARIKSQEALSRAAKQAPTKKIKDCSFKLKEEERKANGCTAFVACSKLDAGNDRDGCCAKHEDCKRPESQTMLNSCVLSCLGQMNVFKAAEESLKNAITQFRLDDIKAIEALNMALTGFETAGGDPTNTDIVTAGNLVSTQKLRDEARQKLSEEMSDPNQGAFEKAISDGDAAGLPDQELQKFREISAVRKVVISACGPKALEAALMHQQFKDFSIAECGTFGDDYDARFIEASRFLAQEKTKVEARIKLEAAVADNDVEKLRAAINAGTVAMLDEAELKKAQALLATLEAAVVEAADKQAAALQGKMNAQQAAANAVASKHTAEEAAANARAEASEKERIRGEEDEKKKRDKETRINKAVEDASASRVFPSKSPEQITICNRICTKLCTEPEQKEGKNVAKHKCVLNCRSENAAFGDKNC